MCICAVACGCPGLLAGETTPKPEETAAYHSRQGDNYRRAGKYAEAEKSYETALSLSKDAVEKVRIYQSLAIVAQKQNDQEKRFGFLKKAREVSKPIPEIYAQITEQMVGELVGAKKLDDAEKMAREALADAKTEHEKLGFWNHICIIYRQKNMLDSLEKECAIAKDEKPPLDKLLMLKAIYEAKGDADKIAEINAKIVGRFPEDQMARREHADALIKQGKLAEAAPLLEAMASSAGEERGKYAEVLARYYLGCGKDEDAARWVQVIKSPSMAVYRRVIAIYVQTKKIDLALAEYDEAAKNAPSEGDSYQLRIEKARLLEKEDRKADASKECELLIGAKGCPEHIVEEAKRIMERAKGTEGAGNKPSR
jgi:tetratricopeptide (TPR) repeat protein